jgi:hypothetical protein
MLNCISVLANVSGMMIVSAFRACFQLSMVNSFGRARFTANSPPPIGRATSRAFSEISTSGVGVSEIVSRPASAKGSAAIRSQVVAMVAMTRAIVASRTDCIEISPTASMGERSEIIRTRRSSLSGPCPSHRGKARRHRTA